jgi:hypothetical protein
MNTPSKGVLYIATGKKWLDEAEYSVASLKRHMPNVQTALVTDTPLENTQFDQVIVVPKCEYVWRFKIEHMKSSPFDYTVFLDTDTYVVQDFSELFEMLTHFDMGMVWENAQVHNKPLHVHPHMPDYFFGFNTGVLAFRKTEGVVQFIDRWLQRLEEYKRTEPGNSPLLVHDQPAFHEVLLASPIRFLVLPNSYNFNVWKVGLARKPAKILHTRPVLRAEYAALARLANEIPEYPKVFVGWRMFLRNGRNDYVQVADMLQALNGLPSRKFIRLRALVRARGIPALVTWVGRYMARRAGQRLG